MCSLLGDLTLTTKHNAHRTGDISPLAFQVSYPGNYLNNKAT